MPDYDKLHEEFLSTLNNCIINKECLESEFNRFVFARTLEKVGEELGQITESLSKSQNKVKKDE